MLQGGEQMNLRLRRVREGYTQKELANKLGISKEHYNKVENGKLSPGRDLVIKLDLLFGKEWR